MREALFKIKNWWQKKVKQYCWSTWNSGECRGNEKTVLNLCDSRGVILLNSHLYQNSPFWKCPFMYSLLCSLTTQLRVAGMAIYPFYIRKLRLKAESCLSNIKGAEPGLHFSPDMCSTFFYIIFFYIVLTLPCYRGYITNETKLKIMG